MKLVKRRRIEVIVDEPLAASITRAADKAEISGYTLLPALSGKGAGGHWEDERVTRADTKIVFVAVTMAEKETVFLDAIKPLVVSHGLTVFCSDTERLEA